jgi:CubicO group peptidase (beta-lactamase class C family)
VRAGLPVALAIAAVLVASAPAEVASGDRRDVSPLLRPILEKHGLPGLAGVVLRGDSVVATGVAGLRERGHDEKLATSDRFHLGSCTKSMTATLVATLVHEKKLAWATTIAQVFTDVKMHEDWKAVTLEQLLTNRSGAPGGLDRDGLWMKLCGIADKPGPVQRRALVEGVLAHAPEAAPGTKFIYSNAGFSIAGAMAERVTGKAWEDLMRERIFRPLGMKSAGFSAPGTKTRIDEPRGHRPDGTPVEPGLGADNPGAIGPAGTVHCSLEDWARYVAVHVRLDPDGCGRTPRDAGTLVESLGGRAVFAKLHAPVGDYAMGWGITERDWAGGKTLTHNGSNTMWFCVAWLAPRKDFAVLIGANQGGDEAAKACDEAAWALIEDEQKRWR